MCFNVFHMRLLPCLYYHIRDGK